MRQRNSAASTDDYKVPVKLLLEAGADPNASWADASGARSTRLHLIAASL